MKLAFCITHSRRQAEDIMHRLESENFSDDRISVIFPDKGALTLPGVGPFIAAGPIVGALSRVTQTGNRGIASGLAGLGVSEELASHYQGEVESGNFFLSVHAVSFAELDRAKGIFADMGAQDVCAAGAGCAFCATAAGK